MRLHLHRAFIGLLAFSPAICFSQAPAAKEAVKDAAKESVKEAAKPAAAPTATARPKPKPNVPPTMADVPYGTHPRQVIDFYKADTKEPAPVMVFIHGGSWLAGDKAGVGDVKTYLDNGVSVVGVNYRYVSQAKEAGIKPPVMAPLHDAARAIQFVRSKAAEWNIDKKRIACTGGSAGACSSLWLAFHGDLADPKSEDPVARESTRIIAAAVNGAQTSLDPKQMREWMPNSSYGAHAYGLPNFQAMYDARQEILPWIKEYSPYEQVTSDDPPVYLFYGRAPSKDPMAPDPTHSANFGVGLQEKCKAEKVECELQYPGAPDVKHATIPIFIIEKLTGKTLPAPVVKPAAKPAAK
jgi:acetyl esterase/lipase